ncbi:MAG: hypothetical protein ACYTBZ_19830 [Planctomycetota bacterium]
MSWTNPTDSNYQATWICYRNDREPATPLDGTFLADLPDAPGSPANFTHLDAIQCSSSIYYAAFAHDGVRHFSTPATATLAGGSLPDSDNDGVPDACDLCPNTIPGMTGLVDPHGCPPLIPADFDRDGDVDSDDHDLFEACASGPMIPLTPGCEDKDLDSDNDVDQEDFGIFQRCHSGPNILANPTCAD